MNNGWIKLHRKLRENEIWEKEPFDKRSAWIDLLLRATHKEEKFLIGNTVIKVKSGEVFTSEKKLAKNWKWSRHKVRNFFILLEQIGQIGTPKRTSRYTLLTIVNWEQYQSDNSKKDTKKDIKRTSKGHPRDTYKNVKNGKNVKKEHSLFDFWNSLKIIIHKNIKGKVGNRTFKGCLEQALKDNTEEIIRDAMQNYKNILEGEEYFWKYRWTVGEFLIRGLDKFLTINKPFENFVIKEEKGGNQNRGHYKEKEKSRREDKYGNLYEV